ncbi:unnamed protein product [Brassica oleracea var. botrytis]|uniref:(rape) hypothetical protein n=1 Tax=Brassica napus TaxID=3708 RepID=A0A078H078_BRANA|nr:unnamed protein product [Brassica napus]CDY30243.1 BnaC04g31540D [Brassica napus]
MIFSYPLVFFFSIVVGESPIWTGLKSGIGLRGIVETL